MRLMIKPIRRYCKIYGPICVGMEKEKDMEVHGRLTDRKTDRQGGGKTDRPTNRQKETL